MPEDANSFLLVAPIRPRSVNAGGRGKQHFEERIRVAANADWGEEKGFIGERLYARITHVFSTTKHPQADVDNIAKWILDALKGVVIGDDRYILQCLLTKIEIGIEGVDFGRIANPKLMEKVASCNQSEHILIVEIGVLSDSEPMINSGPIEVSK